MDDDLQSTNEWIPFEIGDFQPQTSRSSPRNSTSPNDNLSGQPKLDDLLPPFHGYRGRGEFNGVNKRAIEAANCGESVLKFFMLFITESILMAFVVATNTYGRMYHKSYWKKDLDIAEMKAFIAIILSLGVIKYPNRDIAWESSSFGNQFIKELMTKDRFNQIIRCWRYENYENTTSSQRKAFRAASPFWGLKSLAVIVAASFKNMYHPGQLLDIDEQCVPWKGRHKCKCYNPNKPEKWHFKCFAMNCPYTGYQCDFYFYEGAAEERDADVAATMQPIKYLFLDNPLYKNRGHVLVTDNWYTGMENMEQVVSSGNHYLGTVRTNKRGLPDKEHFFPKTGRNKKQRGDMYQMKKTLPGSDKDVYFIAWQDNKPVHMLSSMPAVKTSCTRVMRNADGSWDPNRIIDRPDKVEVYNKSMGGTDSNDQRNAYYRPNVKCTNSWYPRTFIHVIVLCCINSYIIYYLFFKLDRKVYTYLDFLRELINELAEDELAKTRNSANNSEDEVKETQYKKSWEHDESRLRGVHVPQIIKKDKVETLNKEANTKVTRHFKRGRCILCRHQIDICCEQCQVYLCCSENKTYGKSCWKVFHFDPDFTVA